MPTKRRDPGRGSPRSAGSRRAWWRRHPSAAVVVAAFAIGGILVATTLWSDRAGNRAGPDPDVLAVGGKLYAQSCASCHGASGAGFARAGVPAPPLDGSAHSWHHSDDQILGLIRDGGSIMPAVGHDWSDAQRAAVLTFVKARWEPWQRDRQPGTIGE